MKLRAMPDNKLLLTLTGLSSEEGHVRFADLLKELSNLETALREIDKGSSNAGKPTVYYRVTALSHNSPATFELEERPLVNSSDREPNHPIRELARILANLDHPQEVADVDAQILSSIASMARPVGKSLAGASIATDSVSFELDSTIPRKIRDLLRPAEEYGSVAAGMLDAINIHEGANVFTLYPDVGAPKISCNFPKALLPQALEAIGNFVEIRGQFRKRRSARFPFAATVNELERLPGQEEAPSLMDLRGIAPDLTKGLASVEFISKMRGVSA